METKMMKSVFRAFFGILIFSTSVSYALDFSSEQSPVPISDNQIGIGRRNVKLPAGEWHFISHLKGAVRQEGNATIPTHTGYIARVHEQKFVMGVVLEMAENNNQVRSWNNEPCKEEGRLLKSELNGNVLTPECIVMNRRANHLKGASGPFFTPAMNWLEEKKIEAIGPVYDIHYSRYSGSGHGRVRFFIPVNQFKNQEAAVAWANGIPEVFKGFFEHKTREVEIPAIQ
jgi:hypothetical protein